MSDPTTGKDDGADRGPGFEAYVIVMTVVSVTAIALRLVSRALPSPAGGGRTYQPRLWWDDLLALAAAPFVLTSLGLALALVHFGLGRHEWQLSPGQQTMQSKVTIAENLMYYASLFFTRASALVFFRRVFPAQASRAFTRALWATHGLNGAWILGTVFGNLFICWPVSANWTPGSGCNACPAWRGAAISSAAIDLIILLLPLPMILSLQTSARRKAGITVIFALGYSVIAISLGRTIVVITSAARFDNDYSYGSVETQYWQTTEPTIGLLCICLPAMLTLGRRIYVSRLSTLSTISSKVSSAFSSHEKSAMIKSESGDFSTQLELQKSSARPQSPESASIPSIDSRSRMIQDMAGLQYPYSTRVHGGREHSPADGQDIPEQGIWVESHISIRRQKGQK
ncbi:hypothetical protein GGR56DRAFT_87122 [Xylariaceae sp. FL0804]|nr:hypothetical protein GGR56DRAFT_87122 [Xylariaceae sp. FL0804]